MCALHRLVEYLDFRLLRSVRFEDQVVGIQPDHGRDVQLKHLQLAQGTRLAILALNCTPLFGEPVQPAIAVLT